MTSPTHDNSVLVLIADDERPIADVIASVIHDLGYQVLVAGHGHDALELARTSWPALVITDLMMPQLDGAALIAALRDEATKHGRPRVPAILMTAGSMEHAHKVGADVVLGKPFDLADLEHLVERFLTAPRAAEPRAGA